MSWRDELSGSEFSQRAGKEYALAVFRAFDREKTIDADVFYKLSPTDQLRFSLKVLCYDNEAIRGLWGDVISDYETVHSVDLSNPKQPIVTFKLRVPHRASNVNGTMHGGAVATFIDNASSWSLMASPTFWKDKPQDLKAAILDSFIRLGVSRNITLTYLRPILVQSEVYLVCKILSNTRRMAYFTWEILDTEGRQLVVGHHDKVKIDQESRL